MMSKWMVVPYQKPIEKPADSKVLEFDSQMTTILSNPKLNAHEKVSFYNQALAKFQTHFDPQTFQQSPAILDVASSVKNLVQQQMQIQEQNQKSEPALANIANNVEALSQKMPAKSNMKPFKRTLANLYDIVVKTEAETKKTQSEIARLNRIMSGDEKFDDPTPEKYNEPRDDDAKSDDDDDDETVDDEETNTF